MLEKVAKTTNSWSMVRENLKKGGSSKDDELMATLSMKAQKIEALTLNQARGVHAMQRTPSHLSLDYS